MMMALVSVWGKEKAHDIALWPLFDVNSTLNVAYPWYAGLAKAATLPAYEFEARLPDIEAVDPSLNPFH